MAKYEDKGNKDSSRQEALGKEGREKGNTNLGSTEVMADNFKPGLLNFCKGCVVGGGGRECAGIPIASGMGQMGDKDPILPHRVPEAILPLRFLLFPPDRLNMGDLEQREPCGKDKKEIEQPDDICLLSSVPSRIRSPLS